MARKSAIRPIASSSIVDVGQRDQPEVVGLGPVEAGAVGDQDLLGPQQVDHELLVVLDRRRPRGPGAGSSRARRCGSTEETPGISLSSRCGEHALLVEAAAGHDQLLDRLVAAERGLDRVLGRHVGAHPHVRDQGEALEEVLGELLGPGDHHPAGAVAADPVGLGEPAEGQAEHVVAGGGRRVVVHGVVEEDLLVDLVGEDDQLVPPGDVDQALDDLLAVDGAGGVVRVDDHQARGCSR